MHFNEGADITETTKGVGNLFLWAFQTIHCTKPFIYDPDLAYRSILWCTRNIAYCLI